MKERLTSLAAIPPVASAPRPEPASNSSMARVYRAVISCQHSMQAYLRSRAQLRATQTPQLIPFSLPFIAISSPFMTKQARP
jgi:hypothetical protein